MALGLDNALEVLGNETQVWVFGLNVFLVPSTLQSSQGYCKECAKFLLGLLNNQVIFLFKLPCRLI